MCVKITSMMLIYFVEVNIFEDDDLCVATGLSLNGRLFVSPREHIDALVWIKKS